MHPLFDRRARLTLYVLTWLIAGIPLAEIARQVTPQPAAFAHAFAVPLSLFYGFAVLSAWWVCRRYPLTGERPGRAIQFQLLAALQVSAVWCAAGALWGVLLARFSPFDASRAVILRDVALLFGAGIPLYLLSAVIHYLFLAFEASHAAERRVLESHVTAREAELRALRAQLNPHFLFNSLNSINALVGSNPEGARRMCEGLGDFLRRTLALGARDFVTLGEELELVERYLAIEQVRFGERLRVERDLDPQAIACHVPPLLLQPLVENAVKHGVAGRIEGGVVRLEAHRRGAMLDIAVENPVDADAPTQRGSGLGLENVRRRLEAFGARDARLDAVREPERFRVTLTLPAVDGVAPEASRG